nr:uncharacterized protein LOC115266161 [Aedes albopictus]
MASTFTGPAASASAENPINLMGPAPSSSPSKRKRSVKENKKPVLQKYKEEWAAVGDFKCFSKYENDPFYAWCKICLDRLNISRGGKSNLTTHLQTKRHQEAATKILTEEKENMSQYTYPEKLMEAEIKLCAWAVENNVSFAAVDSLVSVLKTMDPDSAVFSKLKLGRTKAGAVVDGVLAPVQHDELVGKMRKQNFSLMIDESTDISTAKTLAMVVRLLEDDTDKFQVCDTVYTIVELKACDHRSIYNAIIDEFKKDNIDYKKRLKGFASDGASVMMGSQNSVMKLLKNDCPDLIVVKCTCHSLALCASYACEALPPYVEQLLRDIYSYLSHSPKRSAEFKTIQEILELDPLKMLHPSQTRWLSLEAVVSRNLERLSELKLFFSFQQNYDQNQTARRILTHLNDPMTKPILEFLNYVLPLVNRLNRKFQSEASEYIGIYGEMKAFYLLLLNNLCGDKYIKNLRNINAPDFEENILPLHSIYVGLAAEESIKTGGMDEQRKKTFKEICRNFYVELVKQVKKRFNFNEPTFKIR